MTLLDQRIPMQTAEPAAPVGARHVAPGASSRRRIQLDVMRGIALLLVLGNHMDVAPLPGILYWPGVYWTRIGWAGVDLFFVLSGFLISGLIFDEYARHGTVRIGRFLIRRGMKIYPAYFVFIAYLVLLPTAKALVHHTAAGPVFGGKVAELLPNMLFINNYWHAEQEPAPHTWSLAVEEHFYLLAPFVLAFLLRRGKLRLIFPLTAAAAVFCMAARLAEHALWPDVLVLIRCATHTRFDALLTGVALRAFAFLRPATFAALAVGRRAWMLTGAGALCWVPLFFAPFYDPRMATVGLTVIMIGAAAMLAGVYHLNASHFTAPIRRLSFLPKVCAMIGFYSYSIYLWHLTGMRSTEKILVHRMLPLLPSGMVGYLVDVGAQVVGALVLGILMSKLVEYPVLRLRDAIWPSRSSS